MSDPPQYFYRDKLRASPILSHISTGDLCLHYINYEKRNFSAHYHNQHQIIISPDVNSECEISWWLESGEGKQKVLKGQNIIYIKSGTPHAFCTCAKGIYISLGVSEAEALRLTLGNLWEGVRVVEWWKILKQDIFILNVIQVLRFFFCHKQQMHPRDFGALAQVLASHLLTIERRRKPTTAEGLTPWQLRNVDAYIESHFRDKLTVSELASVAGLKKDHFTHLFKTSTGNTPHRYIIARRIGYAQELMKIGKMSLADIAVEAGFYDQSHYGYCVKQFCVSASENYQPILPSAADSSKISQQ